MNKNIHSEKRLYQRHYEESALINARAKDVFAYVDDHSRLSSHMSQSSWMMGGGRMKTETDKSRGRTVGSHIRLSGKVFGITLFLDEVVTQYEPPRIKVWETLGDIRLWVIGHYRMTIKLEPRDSSSLFRVSIDYDLPSRNVWLGRLFGRTYAKWCVQQMIKGVREHFGKK